MSGENDESLMFYISDHLGQFNRLVFNERCVFSKAQQMMT